jgi:hypothetical protein
MGILGNNYNKAGIRKLQQEWDAGFIPRHQIYLHKQYLLFFLIIWFRDARQPFSAAGNISSAPAAPGYFSCS